MLGLGQRPPWEWGLHDESNKGGVGANYKAHSGQKEGEIPVYNSLFFSSTGQGMIAPVVDWIVSILGSIIRELVLWKTIMIVNGRGIADRN